MVDYHKVLFVKGWMGYNWFVEYGGIGWSVTQLYLFNKEFGLVGCLLFLVFGVSMHGASGLGADFCGNWVGKYFFDNVELLALNIMGSVGYEINDQWLIGGGLIVQYFDIIFEK